MVERFQIGSDFLEQRREGLLVNCSSMEKGDVVWHGMKL